MGEIGSASVCGVGGMRKNRFYNLPIEMGLGCVSLDS